MKGEQSTFRNYFAMQSFAAFWQTRLWKVIAAGVFALYLSARLVIWDDPLFGWLEAVAVTFVMTCSMLFYAVCRCRTRMPAALIVVAVYAAASAGLLSSWSFVRDTGRWSFLGPEFKADVAAHAMRNSAALRHYELDSWGFAGSGDTFVYAVYDPSDSLVPTDVKDAAYVPQLHCKVVSIKRKERSWFAVKFYTMTTWDAC